MKLLTIGHRRGGSSGIINADSGARLHDRRQRRPGFTPQARACFLRAQTSTRVPMPSSSSVPGSGVTIGESVNVSASIATNPRPGKPYRYPTPLTPESPKYNVLEQCSWYQVQPTSFMLLFQIRIWLLGVPNEAIEKSLRACQVTPMSETEVTMSISAGLNTAVACVGS